ncbi:putative glycosyl hydrolase [Aspergillus ambiguus]|uniref:beta-glucosidase n=1 Tax=Aspergillus ambiguus TaxID=176160 RepID=UPI003CCE2BED
MRSLYVASAAALLLASSVSASLPDNNLEHFWSYNRSEPVYPSPQIKGLGDWDHAFTKAKALVSRMTNEEKSNITYGYDSAPNGCSGMTGSALRVGFPGICLQDAGNGVRATDMVSSYPAGIHVGASWNRDLAYQRAGYMGAEFKRKGANVALGPVVGPVGRTAKNGRNWEGFGSDPYLAGVLAADSVRGLQQSVIACVKHLIAYEQETNRNVPTLLSHPYNNSVSSNVDDKTMHELYLWAFQDAVKAGAGSVMCSYNRINNSYACQNSKAMNGLLKGELGFQGFVVSDWQAVHTGIATAQAGLDMVMPSSPFWENGSFPMAVKNGTLAQTRLDDMATRVLAAWYKYAELDNPGHGLPASLQDPHHPTDARDPKSKKTIFQGAVEGHVLVKNDNNALPLHKPKLLSLFGYDATIMNKNAMDISSFNSWEFGLDNAVSWPNGTNIDYKMIQKLFDSSIDPTIARPGVALNGTMISGGGSGASTPSYIDAPYNAFQRQAYEDDTFLTWDFSSQKPFVNGGSEACIVFINELASEGMDRPYLADPHSDGLVKHVASQCNNTMVVIHNAGVRLVDGWINNPNITAVIYAHLPGQDSGGSLVEVMYGKQSPSGRLPYTVAKRESDYGSLLSPVVPEGDRDAWYPQCNFTEGVYIDYRAFESANIIPRYAFGYGLTYTNFSYSNLEVSLARGIDTSYIPPGSTVTEGGIPSLWDVVATVNCTVTNTGSVAAAEVAQLYIGIPGGPAKVLRGFDKQLIAPGKERHVTFDLTRRDLSTWDVEKQTWGLQKGNYPVYVGKSVLDIQLTGNISL